MNQPPLFSDPDPAVPVTVEVLDEWIRDCDELDQRWDDILTRLRRLSDLSLSLMSPQSEGIRKEVDDSPE